MPEGWIDLPEWLAGPARAVLADLQGADPIPNLALYAASDEDLDGPVLGLFEGGHEDVPDRVELRWRSGVV
jgi:hypothetical protein